MVSKKSAAFVLIAMLLLSLTTLVLVSCEDAKNKFTVTFVADEQIVAEVSCNKNSKTIQMPGVPPKYGYVGYWENYTLNDEDLTVKAVYIAKQYTVIFDSNRADYGPIEQSIFIFNKTVGYLPEPQKANNYFEGWFWGDTQITPDYVWNTDVEGEIVLIAKWIPATGGITLEFRDSINAYCVTKVANDVTEVVIPSSYNGYSIAAIDNQAFAYCLLLKSVTIPASVTSIGNVGLFAYSDNIESVTIHPDNKFYYSEGNCIIKRYTNELVAGTCLSVIPDSAETIKKFAFSKVGFSTVNIPFGVKYIESFAFIICKNLTSVYIPSSVITVNAFAFYECQQLSTIYYEGTMAQWRQIDKGACSNNTTALEQIVCLDGVIEVSGG